MALARAQRVRKSGDYATVRQQGRSWPGRLLILATLPAPELTVSRAGFILTKKVGNAVMRNQIRRRLQHIVQPYITKISPPHRLITIPRHGASRATFAELQHEWIKLARRSGLISQTEKRISIEPQ